MEYKPQGDAVPSDVEAEVDMSLVLRPLLHVPVVMAGLVLEYLEGVGRVLRSDDGSLVWHGQSAARCIHDRLFRVLHCGMVAVVVGAVGKDRAAVEVQRNVQAAAAVDADGGVVRSRRGEAFATSVA